MTVKKKTPAKESTKRRGGRPIFKATKHQLKAIYELGKRGCNDAEIAEAIGISYPTFQKHKHEFFDILKKGREEGEPIIIDMIENALIKKALGYEYEEITKERVSYQLKPGHKIYTDEMKVTKIVKKHIVASDQAIFYYLGNRAPGRWKSVNYQRHEIEGIENISEYFKAVAAEIKESDTTSN